MSKVIHMKHRYAGRVACKPVGTVGTEYEDPIDDVFRTRVSNREFRWCKRCYKKYMANLESDIESLQGEIEESYALQNELQNQDPNG